MMRENLMDNDHKEGCNERLCDEGVKQWRQTRTMLL